MIGYNINLQSNSKRASGAKGEEKAIEYLKSKNFEIIAHNWRSNSGEIDIIASKDDILIFAEVKANPSGDLESLMRRLDTRKQKKIVETSKLFLLNHRKYSNSIIRFDVLIVDMPGLDAVYHIENAFSESI